MKNLFPGYSKKSDVEIKDIWKRGIIMFDTNVLLNLYRYSEDTRKNILNLIKEVKDQIWLPHQAALEYNKNRYEVIANQVKIYDEFIKNIEKVKEDLNTASKPPFLSKGIHSKLKEIFEEVKKEVDENKTKYSNSLKEDPIYTELCELFENRVTKEFDEESLKEIYKNGEKRYKNKIPPGFEDEKNKSGNEKYGDLIIWEQIINKAKELNKPVIFVTDDGKKDWWWKIKDGRNMGARPELVAEMKKKANVDFYMYSSERFVSYGQEFIVHKVNKKVLNEVQAIQRFNIVEGLKKKRSTSKFHLMDRYHTVSREIMEIDKKLKDLMLENQDDKHLKNIIESYRLKKIYFEGEKDRISFLLRKKYQSFDMKF